MTASLLNMTSASKQIFQQLLDSYFQDRVIIETGACHIWHGPVTYVSNKRTAAYPYKKFRYMVKNDQGQVVRAEKNHYIHHVVYFLRWGKVPVKRLQLEISHLCHEPLCVNVDHLFLEPGKTNKNHTLKCVVGAGGYCEGHGDYPDCVFP